MKVKYLRPARQEFREAIRYYEQQRTGLGRNFRDEVYAAIDRIKAFPSGWHALGPEVRRCQTRRFPYGVIYSIEDGELLIVAIAHLHREPNYWRGRL